MSCTVYDVTCRRYASQVHPINAAIDDAVAEGGGTIYVPGKTHFIPSPIVVPYAAGTTPYNPAPSIHIVGDGIDNTFVQRRLALDTHDLIRIERDFTTVICPKTAGCACPDSVLRTSAPSFPSTGVQATSSIATSRPSERVPASRRTAVPETCGCR